MPISYDLGLTFLSVFLSIFGAWVAILIASEGRSYSFAFGGVLMALGIMDPLSEKFLGHTPIAYKDVAGSGKSNVTFDLVDIERATHYAAEDAEVTLRLWMVLKPRLAATQLTRVYERLERPLVPVLARMSVNARSSRAAATTNNRSAAGYPSSEASRSVSSTKLRLPPV